MKKLLTFLCAVFFGINLFANEVTIGEDAAMESTYLPIAISNSSAASSYNAPFSLSQQLYFASEFSTATSTTITAVKFYYTSGPDFTGANARTLSVWITHTDSTSFANASNKLVSPGTLVFTKKNVEITSGSPYQLVFDTPFEWDGTSNIILTVFDSTGVKNTSATKGQTKMLKTTGIGRFMHKTSSNWTFENWNMKNLPASAPLTSSDRGYVNKTTFVFAEVTVPVPTDISVTDLANNSATLGWTAAAGADSYEIRYGTTSGSLGDATNVGNVTEYNLTGLDISTKYYFQVRTKIGDNYSAWTEEANFTTNHIHDAITYEKWTWTNILPTAAGNYYLTNDVTLSSNWEPLGSINLCLNGHRVFFGSNYGIIDDGQTIAIHDYDGNGYMMSSNYTQTLLVSGASTNVFVDRDELILNNAGGRKIVVTENGFASIIYPLTFDDDADNTVHFNEYAGLHITVRFNRAFLTGSCNTICLPFEVSSAILDYIFGVNHVLRLDNSEYYPATQELSLNFVNAYTLQAGVPYLIQPTQDCSNPEISGVISVNAPSSIETDFIDFNGVLTPTVLEQGNHNLLCVGAGNELFWPNTSNAMKSFRAYFEVKGAARNAVRARIVKGEQSTEDINSIQDNSGKACKRIIDGQFLIEKNGILYNAQGARIQ